MRYARFGEVQISAKKRKMFFASHSKQSVVNGQSGATIAIEILSNSLLHSFIAKNHGIR